MTEAPTSGGRGFHYQENEGTGKDHLRGQSQKPPPARVIAKQRLPAVAPAPHTVRRLRKILLQWQNRPLPALHNPAIVNVTDLTLLPSPYCLHITSHLNEAVDEVRQGEMARLRQQAPAKASLLKRMRWSLLKRMRWSLLKKRSRVRGHARQRFDALIASKQPTARAHLLKEAFAHFWSYQSIHCARRFLEAWCQRTMRSRLPPMKKVARMLRRHQSLILNWFPAKGELSSGVVEGLNNKIRVVTRRAYGFRTFRAMEVALYHTLGRLPQPPPAQIFC